MNLILTNAKKHKVNLRLPKRLIPLFSKVLRSFSKLEMDDILTLKDIMSS